MADVQLDKEVVRGGVVQELPAHVSGASPSFADLAEHEIQHHDDVDVERVEQVYKYAKRISFPRFQDTNQSLTDCQENRPSYHSRYVVVPKVNIRFGANIDQID